MIRAATPGDLVAIVAMSSRFIDTEYPGAIRFDPERLSALALSLMTGAGAVLVVDIAGALVGMMALTTYSHPMNGDTIATEIVWWMEPEARGGRVALQLFAAGEAWARAQGATKFQMIAPSDKVGRFYERIGFERIEVHYQRSL